jgi:hypothetical protein
MKYLIPVIHAENKFQIIRNIYRCKRQGLNNVFLVNHSIGAQLMLQIAVDLPKLFPDLWIGLNCVGFLADDLATIKWPAEISAIWTDDLAISKPAWTQWYFGGAAFKYQNSKKDPVTEAKEAMPRCDIVTTSGKGTGRAPTVGKIRRMKEAIGNQPLAIASGIDEDNIKYFMPYADYFLVNTSISKNFYEFDENLLYRLVKAFRNSEGVV